MTGTRLILNTGLSIMIKKRIFINAVCLYVVFVCGLVLAEPINQNFASPAEINVMKERLAKQLLLGNVGKENPAKIRKLRRDLAKNRIATERDHIKLRLKFRDLLAQSHAIEDAAYVGGNDMIRALVDVLSDPSPGGRILSDFAVRPPRKVAAQKLSTLIRNSPLEQKDAAFYTDVDLQKFLVWWGKNKQRYATNN